MNVEKKGTEDPLYCLEIMTEQMTNDIRNDTVTNFQKGSEFEFNESQ